MSSNELLKKHFTIFDNNIRGNQTIKILKMRTHNILDQSQCYFLDLVNYISDPNTSIGLLLEIVTKAIKNEQNTRVIISNPDIFRSYFKKIIEKEKEDQFSLLWKLIIKVYNNSHLDENLAIAFLVDELVHDHLSTSNLPFFVEFLSLIFHRFHTCKMIVSKVSICRIDFNNVPLPSIQGLLKNFIIMFSTQRNSFEVVVI